ncbi:hypothetical protein LTR78_000897 [Recurvomyces mirabilis]|uniref:Uncharacterized protein n=1 Tax=Recurvomyces mirabilis TaxID=574656 RepID=A0AAE0WVY5_9PEZI|nr:hypothetical protein LTR78_000897 [Recurvomyces mirabilis]KAK5158868.1 hypothetical protein LTS14_002976 [Recurvomyces mirabilis]
MAPKKNKSNGKGNAVNPAAVPAADSVAAPTAGPSRARSSRKGRETVGGRKRRRADTDIAEDETGEENDSADEEGLEQEAAQAAGPLATNGLGRDRKTAGGRKRRRAQPAVDPDQEHAVFDVEQPELVAEPAEKPPAARILAAQESTTDITLKDGEARLTVRLQVSLDEDSSSRLAYHARLYVSYIDRDDVDEGGEYAGYISSWRIDKPTAAKMNAKASWTDELLPPKASKGKGGISETAKCLQALFDKDGSLSKNVEDAEVCKSLEDESLMFIGMIYFEPGFRGKGLLASAFDGYYTSLRQLPEWFAFAGNIVLVPAKPVEHQAAWGKTPDDEVEKILIGTYEKAGYTRLADAELRIGPGKFERLVVMGRMVK